jgi:hypothetical protein
MNLVIYIATGVLCIVLGLAAGPYFARKTANQIISGSKTEAKLLQYEGTTNSEEIK